MRIIYSLIFILFTIGYAYGQNTISPTVEKVKINGKVFYAHPVKKKETLYSLSKAYQVTIEQILQYNKTAAAGLQKGSILYIPVNAANNQEENTANKLSDSSPNRTIHSEKKDAQVATVTGKADDNAGVTYQKQDRKKYKRHTVKWYEDITDISEKYAIPVEAIVALNQLKSGQIRTRQVLLIPDKTYVDNLAIQQKNKEYIQSQSGNNRQQSITGNNMAVANGEEPGKEESAGSSLLAETDDFLTEVPFRRSGEPMEIAYILPLNSTYPSNLSSNFMDFYAGALLAVNDMKKQNKQLVINLYDQNEYQTIYSIINTPGFSRNQLIIGPVRHNTIKEITQYAEQTKIPVVSPMDQTADPLVNECRYLVQVPTTVVKQIENIVEVLSAYQQSNNSNVLLINEKNGKDTTYINMAERILNQKGIPYSVISYGILNGRTIHSTILSSIDSVSGNPNIVFVPSNSEAFVNDVVRNMDLCLNSKIMITLFGLPKWRSFETIDVEQFHKMNLHLSLPYYVDYSNAQVKEFLLQYRALYHTEPTPYAFQGYDITRYFISQLEKYSNRFINLKYLETDALLQSDFRFTRRERSCGFENHATRNIIYNPDFTISIIK